MTSPPDARQGAALTKRRRWAATAGLLLGIFLAALEATVVSTAMPTVVAHLGGLDRYSWVFSAYLVASTATVPLWGRLSDLYGRRPIYLAAIGLFVTGSMLAGVSQSMLQLVVFRAIQGLGAGGLIPLALTIIGEIYTLAERTRMQAVFSSVWGVASVAGPLVGGVITDSINWRWIFYLNLPFGVLAAIIVHRTLPEHAKSRAVKVDWTGGGLLCLSTTLLLIALSEWSAWWALMTAASIAALAHVERTVAHPIVPLTLFRSRTVTVATVVGLLAGMPLFGAIAFIPLLVQVATGGSATSAGQILTPLYLTWVLASIVAARMLLRIGVRASTVAGTAAIFLSSAALPWLAVGSSRVLLLANMGLMGTGLGFAMLSLLLAVQHSVLRSELGVATSLNLFARSIGGAIGVAIMGVILASSVDGASPIFAGALEAASVAGLSPELKQPLIAALQRALGSGAVASGLALVASFWVPPFAPDSGQESAAHIVAAEMGGTEG
jgi:EmrB/QacA subfamily drug resistance transporter